MKVTSNSSILIALSSIRRLELLEQRFPVIAAALTPKAVLEDTRMKRQDEEDVSLVKVPTEEELLWVL